MIEVLKQLVDALEKANRQCSYHNIAPHCAYDEAIQAGKQAIAQLESQEPVAWVAEDVCEGQRIDGRPRKIWWECEKNVGMAFYTHPPQRTWVGLTNQEIDSYFEDHGYSTSEYYYPVIKDIEARLRERNI
jgi:hypothetical protein